MAYFFEGKILAFYIVIFAAFLLIYGIGRRKTELPVYIVTGVIFGIYLYFLIRITQFPVMRTPGMEEALGGREAMMPVWWALSLGACLGGNGTLIGASANVIVAGIAAREGHPISFLRFLIWSVPVMLLSVAMAGVFLYLEYFI